MIILHFRGCCRVASISLMPEGLLDDLDHQSLVDFFAYLASK